MPPKPARKNGKRNHTRLAAAISTERIGTTAQPSRWVDNRSHGDAPSMEMTKPPTLSPRVVSTDCSCLITSAWNWEHAPLLQRDENWNQPLAFSQRAQGLPYNSAESPLRVTGFHGAAGGGGTGQ